MNYYADMGDLIEVLIFVAIVGISLIARAIKAANEKKGTTSFRKKAESKLNTWFEPDQNQHNQWQGLQSGNQTERNSPYYEPEYTNPYQTQPEIYSQPYERTTTNNTGAWEQQISTREENGVSSREVGIAERKRRYNSAKAMATALPKGRQIARRATLGTNRKIILSINDRGELRRGMLMKEVLAEPRAFDV